jgi:tRNA 2-thiouridine synthesizing protein D
MSSFAVIVQGAPYSSQAAHSAYHFCAAVLASGHTIHRLFFYQDGVLNASALCVPPQDEMHLPRAWQQLIRQHQLDAVVCIASALKRGIVDATEAERHTLPAASLLEGFGIGGLGLLMDTMAKADRVLNFAP